MQCLETKIYENYTNYEETEVKDYNDNIFMFIEKFEERMRKKLLEDVQKHENRVYILDEDEDF